MEIKAIMNMSLGTLDFEVGGTRYNGFTDVPREGLWFAYSSYNKDSQVEIM